MKNISLMEINDAVPEVDTGLLTGWLNRADLARELTLTVDTLQRWETRRSSTFTWGTGAVAARPMPCAASPRRSGNALREIWWPWPTCRPRRSTPAIRLRGG